MRDRLIELIDYGCNDYASYSTEMAMAGNYGMESMGEFIADNILADGWIRPPCKVGDEVYVVDYTRLGNMIFDCTIEEISNFTYGTYYYLNWGLHIPRFKACQENSFGKTVFFTREEAEKVLKGDEQK